MLQMFLGVGLGYQLQHDNNVSFPYVNTIIPACNEKALLLASSLYSQLKNSCVNKEKSLETTLKQHLLPVRELDPLGDGRHYRIL